VRVPELAGWLRQCQRRPVIRESELPAGNFQDAKANWLPGRCGLPLPALVAGTGRWLLSGCRMSMVTSRRLGLGNAGALGVLRAEALWRCGRGETRPGTHDQMRSGVAGLGPHSSLGTQLLPRIHTDFLG